MPSTIAGRGRSPTGWHARSSRPDQETPRPLSARSVLPGALLPLAYHAIITSLHREASALHPDTSKTFIRSGDDCHTALATPTFCVGTAHGIPLYPWSQEFNGTENGWTNIVEDFVPIP